MKQKTNPIFAKNMKYLLKKNNMRQVDLARNLGMTKPAISNYVSGRLPHRDALYVIASYFGVTTDELAYSDNFSTQKNVLKEDAAVSFIVSFFKKTLSCTDVIYRKENFYGEFSSPIPVYKNMECYAVMAYDNLMSGYGIAKGSISYFASTEPVADGEIAAVLIKSEKKIVIRKVSYKDKTLILASDSTEEKFKISSKNCEAVVLGKIVHSSFNPNK